MHLGENIRKNNSRKRRHSVNGTNKEHLNIAPPKKMQTCTRPLKPLHKVHSKSKIHIRFDDEPDLKPGKVSKNYEAKPDSVTIGSTPEENKSSSIHKKKKKKNNIVSSNNVPAVKNENVENSSIASVSDKNKLVGHKKIVKDNNVSKGVADITHKKASGDSNWNRFLKEQNISAKTTVNTTVVRSSGNSELRKSEGPKIDGKVKLTKVIGLDCEMVGIGDEGKEHMLARVSIVNQNGDCIYDKFVKPKEQVVNYRTFVSGVRPEDIENGEEFEKVQKEVAEILKGRRLVGHSLKNDLSVLRLSHPKWSIRDTSRFFREKGKGTPGLKKLAFEHLGVKIQEGEHSSVQDAHAAVQLYKMFSKQWESGGGNWATNRLKLNKARVMNSNSNLICASDV